MEKSLFREGPCRWNPVVTEVMLAIVTTALVAMIASTCIPVVFACDGACRRWNLKKRTSNDQKTSENISLASSKYISPRMVKKIKFEEGCAKVKPQLFYSAPSDEVNEVENNYEEIGSETGQANKAEGPVKKPDDLKVDVERV